MSTDHKEAMTFERIVFRATRDYLCAYPTLVNGMTRTKEEFCEELLLETTDQMDLVVHNDEVNTFHHVIESLMEICDHEPMQAEQCAWIVHNNGKCNVKRGTRERLKPMCTALHDRGISAEIQ